MEKMDRRKQNPQLFKKGVSGNPAGRPKGAFSLVDMIKAKLQETEEGYTKTNAQVFIDSLMKKAIQDGDVTLMRDMIDRIDGKPKQAIDHTSQGERISLSSLFERSMIGTMNVYEQPKKEKTAQLSGETNDID